MFVHYLIALPLGWPECFAVLAFPIVQGYLPLISLYCRLYSLKGFV